MKCSAAAYFVYDEQFAINDCIPPMPEDKKDWEEYLLKIYDATLSSLLDFQRSQFELQHSKQSTPYNYKMVDHYFKKLKHTLKAPSFNKEEASKQLVPCTKPIITMLRKVFRKV